MTIKRIPVTNGFAPGAVSGAQAGADRTGLDAQTRRQRHRALNAADGTLQLVVSGYWIMVVGAIAMALTLLAFGGMGPQGAHTNAGWLSLMVAMMCMPFAILLLLLGGAKWLRNLRLSKDPVDPRA